MTQWINIQEAGSSKPPDDMSVLLWVVTFYDQEHKHIQKDEICSGYFCSDSKEYCFENFEPIETENNKVKVVAWTLLPSRPLIFLQDRSLWTT